MRLVFGILSTAAIVVVGVVAFIRVTGSDVVITNAGSQTVHVRGALPSAFESALSAAGVNVPNDLPPGVPQLVRVPGLSGFVDAGAGAIDLSLLGQTLHVAALCDRLELDGASLLGHRTEIDLSKKPRHDVQFACR
jgi:hypothetical protein